PPRLFFRPKPSWHHPNSAVPWNSLPKISRIPLTEVCKHLILPNINWSSQLKCFQH
ncbi:hypothetical protein ASPFODRAFT_69792, partial [Aspergillus luchuensis CBS 106.47]